MITYIVELISTIFLIGFCLLHCFLNYFLPTFLVLTEQHTGFHVSHLPACQLYLLFKCLHHLTRGSQHTFPTNVCPLPNNTVMRALYNTVFQSFPHVHHHTCHSCHLSVSRNHTTHRCCCYFEQTIPIRYIKNKKSKSLFNLPLFFLFFFFKSEWNILFYFIFKFTTWFFKIKV